MILTNASRHFYLILYMFPKWENPHISLKRNKYKLTQNRKKKHSLVNAVVVYSVITGSQKL